MRARSPWRVRAGAGEIDRPFYFRSAAKPVQAAVAQRLGAGLVPPRLAVAAASQPAVIGGGGKVGAVRVVVELRTP